MGKEQTLSRRQFLKDGIKALGLTAVSSYAPSLQVNDFLSVFIPPIRKDPETLKLEDYLASIRPDQERISRIVEQHDIFAGFKSFTPEQRIDDLNRYFPIYRAVDLKYQIPWLLIWIMHADETAVSRHPDPNSGGPQEGALQVSRENKGLENAAAGWEFLRLLLNLRYVDDCEGLFKGGLYIRKLADNIKGSQLNISDEGAVLDVVRYNYSAVQHGKARVNQYLRTKNLFD